MTDEIITYALNLVLDDRHIGQWTIAEVQKRLGRSGPQDHEFWQTYTAVMNELIDAVSKRNEKSSSC